MAGGQDKVTIDRAEYNCMKKRIDQKDAEIERLKAMVEAGEMSAKVKTDVLDTKDAEIARLREQLKTNGQVQWDAAREAYRYRDYAELKRLRAEIERHDKFAWLCYMDYCFWGNGGNDKPVPCLCLNDVFAPAADSYELSWEQVPELYEIAKNGTPQDVIDWVKPLYIAAAQEESDENSD